MISTLNDLRGRFGPARDQLLRPTCLAFAISDAHAAARTPWDPLSSEYLFFHAKRRAASLPTTGASMSAIRAAMEHDGQPRETAWPYLPALPKDLGGWKPPADVGEVFCRASDTLDIGFVAIWDCIASDRPALIGMNVSKSFFFPGASGMIDAGEPREPARRHAVVGVAIGEDVGTRFVMIRNSWGSDWGLGGHAWLSERYLGPRVSAVVAMKEVV